MIGPSSVAQGDNMSNRALVAAGIAAVIILLAACRDTQPVYDPGAPRNGAGQLVHPIYGTPLPGGPPLGGG
jgi:hypothetical protein